MTTATAISEAAQPGDIARLSVAPRARQISAATWIIGASLIALFLKLVIAFSTFGSNDVVTFYTFARSLSDHGLEWTYRRGVVWLPVSPIFNHPPVTALYLQLIEHISRHQIAQAYGITFPFLIRLPGILADFVVAIVLARFFESKTGRRLPLWALILFVLSPVSLMVSGFHGNTDSVMVMFLLLASLMCLNNRPWLCGLFLALSCQIKIIPLLFLPVFFFFWMHRRAIVSFLIPFTLASLVLWWEPLVKFPLLFARNVLSYGSFWGIWGITYWLRLTNIHSFKEVSFMDYSLGQAIVSNSLKLIIVGAICLMAWRRRALSGQGLIDSIAYGWIVFFVFSPGICAQYMVWLAPFILILSPGIYAWITATSALFLFFFYNVTAHGLPWYLAISSNSLNTIWTPWTAWPWAALIVSLIVLWRRAVLADPELHLFSLKTLAAKSRP